MKKYFSLFVIVASFVLLGVGCNSYATPADKTTSVKIENFSFQPANLTVKSGTTITWTNNDSAPHTVSADDNSFESGTMSKGDTFTYTFTTPGTVGYYCAFHKSMRGSITITE